MAKFRPLGVVPLGDCAAYVEFSRTLDLEVNSMVQRLAVALRLRGLPWLRDVVPALGGVALHFDPAFEGNVLEVAAELAAQCLKATFFPIGQHVSWHPDILRQVVAKDHTIGSHSWSHVNLAKKSLPEAKDEIENGISAVAITAGRPLGPFSASPA